MGADRGLALWPRGRVRRRGRQGRRHPRQRHPGRLHPRQRAALDCECADSLHVPALRGPRGAAVRRQLPVAVLVQPLGSADRRAAGVRTCERARQLHHGERQDRDRCRAGEPGRQALWNDGLRQHLDQRPGTALPGYAALVQGARELQVLARSVAAVGTCSSGRPVSAERRVTVKSRRTRTMGAYAALCYAACAASAADAPRGLSDVYATLSGKRFVDLTHTFGPTTPHWKGFGEEKVVELYTIKKDGF